MDEDNIKKFNETETSQEYFNHDSLGTKKEVSNLAKWLIKNKLAISDRSAKFTLWVIILACLVSSFIISYITISGPSAIEIRNQIEVLKANDALLAAPIK